MGRLEDEALTAMTVLLKGGHTQSAVARLLGVTEGSVRYHRRRRESGATDGRSRQVSAASAHADAIAHWRDQQTDGRINLAALHGWLVREHGYAASLKSVQRYWWRTYGVGVAPVWWTPSDLRRRVSVCLEAAPLTPLSSGPGSSSWRAPAARQRILPRNSNRVATRSDPGWRPLAAPV